MAIISISRLFATCGDSVATKVAEHLGYKLFDGESVNQRILKLGFPESKLKSYNEKKPGFIASLAKEKDAYLHYLRTSILEEALENNVVFAGKGSFEILKDAENHVSFFINSPLRARIARVAEEYKTNDHKAGVMVLRKDMNQKGYYKTFFGVDIKDSSIYNMSFNTSEKTVDEVAKMISGISKEYITSELEEKGIKKIQELLNLQRLVNMLVLDYELPVMDMRITSDGDRLVLHGIADSSALIERCKTIIQCEMPGWRIDSEIHAVQDTKKVIGR